VLICAASAVPMPRRLRRPSRRPSLAPSLIYSSCRAERRGQHEASPTALHGPIERRGPASARESAQRALTGPGPVARGADRTASGSTRRTSPTWTYGMRPWRHTRSTVAVDAPSAWESARLSTKRGADRVAGASRWSSAGVLSSRAAARTRSSRAERRSLRRHRFSSPSKSRCVGSDPPRYARPSVTDRRSAPSMPLTRAHRAPA
jgi:hypothetical protein